MIFIAACSSNTGSTTGKDSSATPAPAANDITANPDYQKGLDLIGKNDCLTCHKISEKLIGPPYQDVADKYAGMDTAVTHLAKKIISGGSGVWGTAAMTPHVNLSQADAEQMAKYVLLLKTK